MRRLAQCLVFSLCCALCPLAAFGEVTLTTGPGYAPFADPNLPGGGIATQVVQAVFRRLGEPVGLTWLPWKRGYLLTLSGRFDATFPYVRSTVREHDFLYSDPIITTYNYLYTRPGEQLDPDQPASFRDHTICVPQGFYSPLEEKLHDQVGRGEVKVERTPDMSTCLRMLAAGRIDAFNSNEFLVRDLEQQAGGVAYAERSGKPLGTTELMLIAPRSAPGSADLIRRFNAGLQQIKADGSYRSVVPE